MIATLTSTQLAWLYVVFVGLLVIFFTCLAHVQSRQKEQKRHADRMAALQAQQAQRRSVPRTDSAAGAMSRVLEAQRRDPDRRGFTRPAAKGFRGSDRSPEDRMRDQ